MTPAERAREVWFNVLSETCWGTPETIVDAGLHALSEAGLAIVPVEPTEQRWCQPPDGHGLPGPRKFVIFFEDADQGHLVFENEVEARRTYEAVALNWNCYLFASMPLAASNQKEPADG